MSRTLAFGRQGQSGLTLIEMLIVLVIIGIATSAAVLAVGSVSRDRQVETEAARLVSQLTLAVDEGLVGKTKLALIWTERAYEVRRWTEDGWLSAATPLLSQRHELAGDVVLRRADGSADPVEVAEDGLGAPVTLELTGSGPAWRVAFDGFSAKAEPRP